MSISSVTISIRCRKKSAGSDTAVVKTRIQTHGVLYQGVEERCPQDPPAPASEAVTPWVNFSTSYSLNPFTGVEWTEEEIADLTGGVYLHPSGFYPDQRPFCTQVWVSVQRDTGITNYRPISNYYTYYIANVPSDQNVWENLNDIVADGDISYIYSIIPHLGAVGIADLNLAQLEEEIPPPPPVIPWCDAIFSIVFDVSMWFQEAYLITKDWIWPFYLISNFFYFVHRGVWNLLTPIAHFCMWVVEVAEKIIDVLNLDMIWEHFKKWFEWAQWAWEWITNAFNNIANIVTDWWNLEDNPIRLFIESATEGLDELLSAWNDFWTITWPEWMSAFDNLATAWDYFWTVTWPEFLSLEWLFTWWNDRIQDILDLINTAFKLREDWWSGWQEIKEQVFDFFSDPLEYLWSRFTDWFLGPEE